jgi:hypothetical protein
MYNFTNFFYQTTVGYSNFIKIYKLSLKIVICSQDNVVVLYRINYVHWFYYGPNDIKLNFYKVWITHCCLVKKIGKIVHFTLLINRILPLMKICDIEILKIQQFYLKKVKKTLHSLFFFSRTDLENKVIFIIICWKWLYVV